VSGLLTGGDLIRALSGVDREVFLITERMLREGDAVFLDDKRLEDVSGALGRPVIPVGTRGEDMLRAILEAAQWQSR
jgi:NifB/MoaA-like Fe-S oxidoreductase